MPAVASAAGSIQRSRRHRRRRNTGHVFLRESSDEERIADNRGECEIASDVGLPRAGRKTVVVVLTPERVAVAVACHLRDEPLQIVAEGAEALDDRRAKFVALALNELLILRKLVL